MNKRTVDQEVEIINEEELPDVVSENNSLITDEKELQEVVSYLCSEYTKAKAAMDKKYKRVRKWRAKLEAVHSDQVKNTPFKNASHISVPTAPIVTQGLYAKIKGMFDARDPFWTAKALQTANQQDVTDFKTVTRYLDILAKSPYDLNLESVKRDIHLETCHIGTCFVRVPWTTTYWNIKKEEGIGGNTPVSSSGDIFLHDGPEIVPFPVEKITYPQGVPKIEKLPWIAMDFTLTEQELLERETRGIYDNVDVVRKHKRESLDESEEENQKNEDLEFSETTGVFDIVEFYYRYDYDHDGIPEDLLLHIHVDSETCLKQQLNDFGLRDIVVTRHMHRSFALTGRGSGQMTESLVEEIDGIHNMRNDNMKVANMRMIAVSPGTHIGAKEQVYPGKVFVVDKPREDINPIQLGEIYPSSLQAEEQSTQYCYQAIGMSPTQMGFESQVLKSRDTASGQQIRMQAGDSILTSIAEGLVESWSKVGMLVFMQLVRHKDSVLSRERVARRLSDEEIESLERALSIPFEQIPLRISFSIKATDAEHTFENQRQNRMTMSQLYSQHLQETTPIAMQIFGPQGAQIFQNAPMLFNHLLRSYIGKCKFTSELLKFFGEDNPEDYVIDVSGFDQMLDVMKEKIMGQYAQSLVTPLPPPQAPPQGGPQGGPPQGQPPPQGNQNPNQGGMR